MAQPKVGSQPRQEGDRKHGGAALWNRRDAFLRAERGGGSGNRREPSGALPSCTQNFGIDESNLETRRKFIRLGEEERGVLTGLISWARWIAPLDGQDLRLAI